ncbi:hypothetical protein [Escherichia phage CLB_P2]|nr:hypothetical protein [Escherichia phage CLB_P2]
MKIIILFLIMAAFTIYWAVAIPPMIPTLIMGWIILIAQIKYNCFN